MTSRNLAALGLMLLAACGGSSEPDADLPGDGVGVPNGSLEGRRPFPAYNPWNTPIDQAPVDPNSDAIISSIGRDIGLHPDFGANWNGGPFGIPYVVVNGAVVVDDSRLKVRGTGRVLTRT